MNDFKPYYISHSGQDHSHYAQNLRQDLQKVFNTLKGARY